MAATTPTTEPAYIQAGDTTTWQKTIDHNHRHCSR